MYLLHLYPEPQYVKFAGKRSFEGPKSKQPFYYYVNRGDGCRFTWLNSAIGSVGTIVMFVGLYLATFPSRVYPFMLNAVISLLSILGITGGVHRLWSHKAYRARWPFRLYLMIMQTIAGQHTIWSWCEFHRVHHKYTDTDADPHNTKRGMAFAHAGWTFMRTHPEFYDKLKGIDMSDLASDPIVMFQKKYYWPLYVIFAVVLRTAIPMYFFDDHLWMSLVSALTFQMYATHSAALINSAAHLFGDKPYSEQSAANCYKVIPFSLGEGYHNYHHSFPRDYGAAELGSTFNLTKVMIDLMAWLGQTYDLKTTSQFVVNAARQRMAASAALGHSHAHEEAPDEDYETMSSSKSF